MKFSIRIDENDKNIKISHIKEFLSDGNLVKITIELSKREMNRLDYAKNLMKEILDKFNEIAQIDGKPSLEGRCMSCVLKKI